MGWFDSLLGTATSVASDVYGPGGDAWGNGTEMNPGAGGGGFLDNLFSPKNVVSAVTGIGGILSGNEAQKSAQDALAQGSADKITLSNLDFQHQVDLLKLKASLGGGGGGGGGGSGAAMAALNYQKQRDKADRIQKAYGDAIASSQNGSSLTIQALKNLTAGAQAPLGIR